MLRYLNNSDDVKVGITELQERLEISAKVGISVRQVAKQAMNENGQTNFEFFRQGEEELCIASWARWDAQLKGLERRCRNPRHEEVEVLSERQEIFKS